MANINEPIIILETDTNGYYLIKILDKIQRKIVFSDTLKSENKHIAIKGFTPNLFEITIEPVLLNNRWEKILLL
ncbi:MAG TPA: hypothetical protein PK218_04745 [Flavobacterium sp.]|jgi:hypothetical protein|uniref:hypothetical protein n=1 Tax=Flavobacterium sp. TaxID=239 RepID=UPI002B8AFF77|nr:hypothetical protein [Flavobacterium sp.]HPW97848.1 hypothetical protein [Flavobacterium sp.]HQA73519.1 hypothetical protein [Flavobacterium sp.]